MDLASQAACTFVEIPVPALTKARNDTILSPIGLPPNDQEQVERVEAPVRVKASVDVREEVLLEVVELEVVQRVLPPVSLLRPHKPVQADGLSKQ